jgi:hypothetical protein
VNSASRMAIRYTTPSLPREGGTSRSPPLRPTS